MDLLDPARLGEYFVKFQEIADFINRAYYPDLVMAGKAYAGEKSVLGDVGVKNLFTFKEFQLGANDWLFDSGIILNGDISKVHEVDESKITEEATRSWYEDNEPLHPYEGKTNPKYTGFKDAQTIDGDNKSSSTKVIDENGKYSWIKAPRYDGKPMQVGPLANIVVNYAKGNERVVKVVDQFLKDTGLPLGAVFSTLGRTAARMIEAKVVADNGLKAFDNLIANLKVDQETCATYTIDKNKEYKGRYIGHVPRGTLSHWVRIKNGVIDNYQAVVPSTWNASPKDAGGVRGPYEESLIGLKIADLSKPLEIIRVIHSYDPCIACAVHVMDTKGNELGSYKVAQDSIVC
jgi:quinone-reactive Ni/Fe-hydrogenase large subunit